MGSKVPVEIMISVERIHSFLQKTPEQKWNTARFFVTMWLSKLPYAPHRVHLQVSSREYLAVWWSYFPASFNPERSLLEYWGNDIGELRFLWTHLQPGMTFLDIGAHHGLYSIVAAKKMGGVGRVVAFEPSARERDRMQHHLRSNKIDCVTVEPYALAAQEGQAPLAVVVDGYSTMNSLRAPVDHAAKQVIVNTMCLDAYLIQNRIDNVDFLKIDTEGGEVEAFRGAHALLNHIRPLIICEVLDQVTRPWGYAAAEIMSLLRTYDYEWFDIVSNGDLSLHCPKKDYAEGRNYLAVPREKQEHLLSQYQHRFLPHKLGQQDT
jgi:FkbM family methyltransferase